MRLTTPYFGNVSAPN